jgi:hypothetical protein
MSIVRLSSGRFLVIDTIPLSETLLAEINHLTNNGSLIEAVIATHNYHTLYFPPFRAQFPTVPMYGTPRHLRIQPELEWKGAVSDAEVLTKWEPDVSIRIPAGADFLTPAENNHFSCAFVFHHKSRAIHIDDTVMYFENPGCVLRMVGAKAGRMTFHTSITGPGLNKTPEAPYEFRDWVQGLINDWDFDTVVTAHIGNKVGGAKEMLKATLEHFAPTFDSIHRANKEAQAAANSGSSK